MPSSAGHEKRQKQDFSMDASLVPKLQQNVSVQFSVNLLFTTFKQWRFRRGGQPSGQVARLQGWLWGDRPPQLAYNQHLPTIMETLESSSGGSNEGPSWCEVAMLQKNQAQTLITLKLQTG